MFFSSSISNAEIIKDKSHLKIAAISLFVISCINSASIEKLVFFFRHNSLVLRKQCKSSVSKIRSAFGQVSATRHPNCSSIIKRSKSTISGFNSLIKTSKEALFKEMETVSTPIAIKSMAFSLFWEGDAKVMIYCRSKKAFINCNIRFPAAEELGSTQTAPIIKSSFFCNYSVRICCS